MRTNNIDSASPAIRRQARYEWELDYFVQEAVFQAKDQPELMTLIRETVFNDARYEQLPKYRQIALEAYFRGAVDALSRMSGRTTELMEVARIRSDRPKAMPKRKRKIVAPPPPKVPNLYPTRGRKSEPPAWLQEAPIPMQPFPLASDTFLEAV